MSIILLEYLSQFCEGSSDDDYNTRSLRNFLIAIKKNPLLNFPFPQGIDIFDDPYSQTNEECLLLFHFMYEILSSIEMPHPVSNIPCTKTSKCLNCGVMNTGETRDIVDRFILLRPDWDVPSNNSTMNSYPCNSTMNSYPCMDCQQWSAHVETSSYAPVDICIRCEYGYALDNRGHLDLPRCLRLKKYISFGADHNYRIHGLILRQGNTTLAGHFSVVLYCSDEDGVDDLWMFMDDQNFRTSTDVQTFNHKEFTKLFKATKLFGANHIELAIYRKCTRHNPDLTQEWSLGEEVVDNRPCAYPMVTDKRLAKKFWNQNEVRLHLMVYP
jgi:hypothetical protein